MSRSNRPFFAIPVPKGETMPGYKRKAKVSFHPQSPGAVDIAEALRRRGGSFEEWLAIVQEVESFPTVMFCVYASFAAPLLSILPALNFIIDLAGPSSSGKSTTTELAASVWGFPPGSQGGLVRSWNMTRVFAEQVAGAFQDLPIFFDDSQTADSKTLAAMTYMVANGVGRGRGAQKGGVQETLHWRTVLFSNGEELLSSHTEYTGARARIVSLWGRPFGENQGALARRITTGVRQHYGHAGIRFLRALMDACDDRGEWPKLKELYRLRVEQLTNAFPGSGTIDRLAQYCGSVWVAGDLARQVLGIGGDVKSVVMSIMGQASQELEGQDYATRAFDLVRSWAVSNQHRFRGKGDDLRPPNSGYLGVWQESEVGDRYVAFYRNGLREFLTTAGFSPDSVLRGWRQNEWLKTVPDKLTYPIMYAGMREKMIVIPWDVWTREN